jgi:hypothetical protein
MKQTTVVHIQDMITARMRLENPFIERIGVHHEVNGWCCHHVWLHKCAPRLSGAKIGAILAKANKLLAELLQRFEIEDDQRAAG